MNTAAKWPFAESPADVAERLEQALHEFGSMTAAVRCVFIEEGVELENKSEAG